MPTSIIDTMIKYLLFFIALIAILFLYFKKPISNEFDHRDIIAATLILEAGGEKDSNAMIAVYEVIRNRAEKSGQHMMVEIFRRKQFSCWNNIPQRKHLFKKAQQHPKYKIAYQIVDRDEKTNVTNGATHYHADYVLPYWASTMTKTVTIGKHIFYK
jgi:N-acetylmuramoyl-L-alanine amidase